MSQGVSIGYWSADVLLQMLEAAGPDITPEKFEATINGGWTYEPALEGSMGPVAFPDGHSVPTPCAALLKVNGTKFDVVSAFDCYGTIPFSG
jgi:hypothetical protein